MRMLLTGLAVAAAMATAPAAAQDDYAILYNNTINDGGFNQAASEGVERFRSETGVDVRNAVIRTTEESVQRMEAFIRAGVDHLMLIGFVNQPAVQQVASAHPGVRFTLIDGAVDLPNVRSVLFAEDEAAFLAGVAAGLKTETGTVGVVGGMPIPPVRRFMCGFVQGAMHARADVKVEQAVLGDQPVVFRDRDLGAAAGRDMVGRGADVVFAAAGLAGQGTLEAAVRGGALGVGVDTNQNGLHPGRILTSAMKRTDVAAHLSLSDAHAGRWTPGVLRLGMAEGGVDWARDEHNEALVGPIADRIAGYAERLRTGELRLEPFDSAAACRL